MKYEQIERKGTGRMGLRTPIGLRKQARDCKFNGQIASQQTFQFCPTAALNCMQNHKEQCMLATHLDQIWRQQQEASRSPA